MVYGRPMPDHGLLATDRGLWTVGYERAVDVQLDAPRGGVSH